MAQCPKNWPAALPYHASPIYGKQITRQQRSVLAEKRLGDIVLAAEQTPSPSPLVKITHIEDSDHPAYGQCGLFATRHLKPGSFILLYSGTIHGDRSGDYLEATSASPQVSSTGAGLSDYDLWLDREAGLAIDAATCGNEARFINDYRGVSARPNAEFREVWSQKTRQRSMAIFVLPAGNGRGKMSSGKKGISKGQEILVSYGKGFWTHRLACSDTTGWSEYSCLDERELS